MSRCRFVVPETVRIAISDGDWIEVKRELNAGERRAIFARMSKSMHFGEKPEVEPGQVGKAKLIEYLVAWSFRDRQDRPVEVTAEAIDALESDTYAELVAAIDQHEAQQEKEKNAPAGETGSAAT